MGQLQVYGEACQKSFYGPLISPKDLPNSPRGCLTRGQTQGAKLASIYKCNIYIYVYM